MPILIKYYLLVIFLACIISGMYTKPPTLNQAYWICIFQCLRVFPTTSVAYKHGNVPFFFFFLKLFLIERYRSAILYVNAELVNGIRLKVLFVMTLMEISDLQCLKKEVKTSYEES